MFNPKEKPKDEIFYYLIEERLAFQAVVRKIIKDISEFMVKL